MVRGQDVVDLTRTLLVSVARSNIAQLQRGLRRIASYWPGVNWIAESLAQRIEGAHDIDLVRVTEKMQTFVSLLDPGLARRRARGAGAQAQAPGGEGEVKGEGEGEGGEGGYGAGGRVHGDQVADGGGVGQIGAEQAASSMAWGECRVHLSWPLRSGWARGLPTC